MRVRTWAQPEIMNGVPPSEPHPTQMDIEAAEQQLSGVRFPDDYRRWLMEHNGMEGWFGETFVMLYSLADVVGVTRAAEAEDRLPGFVAIGSDGSRESLAFDFRAAPARIVLLDITAESWDDAVSQASSFSEFMAQRKRGEPFVWEPPEA